MGRLLHFTSFGGIDGEEKLATRRWWFRWKAEKNAAVTGTVITNYCREVCKIEVRPGWGDSFISRHSAELVEKNSSPQEAALLQVPRVFIDHAVRSMHDAV
jgi:hypothetical protein